MSGLMKPLTLLTAASSLEAVPDVARVWSLSNWPI